MSGTLETTLRESAPLFWLTSTSGAVLVVVLIVLLVERELVVQRHPDDRRTGRIFAVAAAPLSIAAAIVVAVRFVAGA